MSTIKQSRVMHMAHVLYKHQSDLRQVIVSRPDWSRAVTDAWKIQRVRDKLHEGVVRLEYLTNSGEINTRRGTLNMEIIPGSKAPKGVQKEWEQLGLCYPDWGTVKYYDLDAKAWRSFKIENLRTALRMDYEIELSTSFPATDEWLF